MRKIKPNANPTLHEPGKNMPSYQFELQAPPSEERSRELWLQHCAGFILLEAVREYALSEIAPELAEGARAAVEKGINDALYGLMMVIDGVAAGLSNAEDRVELRVVARFVENYGRDSERVSMKLDLAEGDGMCMGYHGWLEGDYERIRWRWKSNDPE